MKRKNERLFLVDGMAIAYRAYFAFLQRPLVNSKGENTSAVYGFVTFLNRILEREVPDHIAVVFDTAAPTFRHRAYKEYKATRQRMPEDMVPQLATLKDVVRAYNIPVIELEGYEADDVIGTLAKRAEREAIDAFLVTADKDFMQLVSKNTKLYRPGRQGDDAEIVDVAGVKERFGVAPEKVIDVLGLTGDSSDNVPGVAGVGEKTAIPLVQEFGTIEQIYRSLKKIRREGLRKKLEEGEEMAFLSKKLVTIDIKVPLDIDFHTLRAGTKDTTKLIEIFDRLEFRSLSQKLRKEQGDNRAPTATPPVPAEFITIGNDRHVYTLVETMDEFEKLCQELQSAKEFVFDTETTSTDPLRAELVGISFSPRPREAYFALISPPSSKDSGLFGSDGTGAHRGLNLDFVRTRLKPILQDSAVLKIGHNIKYDILVLRSHGFEVAGPIYDTMVASYVLRADGQHGMDAASVEYLKYKPISYEELTGTGKDQRPLREVDSNALSDYSCEDSDITYRLRDELSRRLVNEKLMGLCQDVEFPLTAVLADIELTGVRVDADFLASMSKELERELDALVRDVHKLAGGPFNINSTQQLSDVLFTKLKLPPVRKTKTGFSTDVAVLESLRSSHPIIEKLLDVRQLSKLKSTYVDALPKLVNPKTGRVHTSYNQTVAATGRLSSSDPNLQNIPIRTEIGRSIRRAFIAEKGFRILSADYSQVELRVMAHISGDEALAEAFRNGEDVHATTAAKVFGVQPSDVSRDMRRKAKEINFGIMYGIGPFGLGNRLEIPQSEAKDIIAKYFERFPKVKLYIGTTIEQAKRLGYVSTMLGRRRYLPDIRSANQSVRSNAERQAINMPIQGTAADMIKLAMVKIHSEMKRRQMSSRMLMQVHDELVFEVQKDEEREVGDLVRRLMKEALPLSVPLDVDVGVGSNWLEAH